MKHLLIITLLLCSGLIKAQSKDIPQSNVPPVVVSTFNQKFPDAKDVEWELENNTYHVEFTIGTVEYDAWIDSNGQLSSYQQEIKNAELPDAVKTAIKKDFTGFRIDDADKKDENGVITYMLELKKGGKEWHAVYTADGRLISRMEDN
jgi:uncharacterized membrane protein YkoI